MFCFSIKMIHNCKYLKLKMRVVSDKAAQLNVTQSFRVVVFTCFEPKKESFVAQPGLTEWQEWTNRGWRWCLLTLSMLWLLWAVITSHCMYHFWNPLGRNWWPFLVRALPWWCSLGVRVLRWPVVVWKMQIQQTDASGGKKQWWSMHLQSSDSEAIPAVVSPTIHLPVSILAAFALVTVKVFGEPVLMYGRWQISWTSSGGV